MACCRATAPFPGRATSAVRWQGSLRLWCKEKNEKDYLACCSNQRPTNRNTVESTGFKKLLSGVGNGCHHARGRDSTNPRIITGIIKDIEGIIATDSHA